MSARAAARLFGRFGASDGLLLGALASFACALKHHYGTASPEALRFMLGPVARLVELLTSQRFPFEAHVGYVSTELGTAIVPACAGINFWIIATAVLVLGSLERFDGPALLPKLLCFAFAVLLAFGCTLLVNALRIVCDLELRALALPAARSADAHRVLGVVLYLGSACLLHAAAARRRPPRQEHA